MNTWSKRAAIAAGAAAPGSGGAAPLQTGGVTVVSRERAFAMLDEWKVRLTENGAVRPALVHREEFRCPPSTLMTLPVM